MKIPSLILTSLIVGNCCFKYVKAFSDLFTALTRIMPSFYEEIAVIISVDQLRGPLLRFLYLVLKNVLVTIFSYYNFPMEIYCPIHEGNN